MTALVGSSWSFTTETLSSHPNVLLPPGQSGGDPEQGSEYRDRMPPKGRGVPHFSSIPFLSSHFISSVQWSLQWSSGQSPLRYQTTTACQSGTKVYESVDDMTLYFGKYLV